MNEILYIILTTLFIYTTFIWSFDYSRLFIGFIWVVSLIGFVVLTLVKAMMWLDK